jgi:hypothetical protein
VVEINAHAVTECRVRCRIIEEVVERPINRGNLGDDANGAGH